MEILIPYEVDKEVLGKGDFPNLKPNWSKLKRSPNVRVLPKLETDGSQPEVVATVARIRGTAAARALKLRRDLGEATVIAHAVHLRSQGRRVFVLIDDGGAKQLARSERLQVVTIETLLMAAVKRKVLAPEKLQKTYEQLVPFGNGLPSWDASELKKSYRDWRAEQRAAAAESDA